MAANKETSIGIKLTADLRNYQKNLQTAQRESKQFKNNVKTELGEVKNLFGDLMRGDFTALPGFFKGATAAAGGFAKGLNGVKIALIATGIGALIVGLGTAIAAVTQYFKGTEEGQLVFAKVMNKIKAYTSPIIDILGTLGKTIVQLFQGKFAEAWETASGSIKKAADNIKLNKANLQELNALEETIVQRRRQVKDLEAKNEAEIAELRNKSQDEENYNAQQRLGFINKAIALERELGGSKVALANEEYRLAKLKDDQGDNTKEQTDETLELQREALRVQRDTDTGLRRMLEKQQSIGKEVRAEIAAREQLAARMKEQADNKRYTSLETRKVDYRFGGAPVDSKTLGNLTPFLDENAKKLQQFKDEFNQAIGDEQAAKIGSLQNSFSSLAGSIGGAAGSFLQLAADMLTLIPQLIAQVVALTAAKQGEAMASGIAASQSVPFPFNIISIAATVAAIISAFAKMPKFATGGVVAGASYYGDNKIVRVNSGEEILTRNDPRHRYNQGGATGAAPAMLPADIRLMDDHILISYSRALARQRSRT